LSTAKEPYVLFTDWREVKPCVEAMALQGLENHPMFTSVFCIDVKQQCRAERWVSTLAERKDPIYINGSLPFAESTAMSLLLQASKMVCNEPLSLLNDLMNCDVQTSCRFEVVHSTTNEQVPSMFEEVQPTKDEVQATQRPYHIPSRRADIPMLPLFELTRTKNGRQAHTVSRWTQLTKQDLPVLHACQQSQLKENQVQSLPLCETKPTNNSVTVFLHANPEVTEPQSKADAYVAWIWESLGSPAEVEKALLAAMPDRYEE